MGNLRGQGDLELLRQCVALSASTTPHRCMQAVGLCELRESGAMLGVSLDLYIVVRCIAHSIKLFAEDGSYLRDVSQR
jgi:hypothetical protein